VEKRLDWCRLERLIFTLRSRFFAGSKSAAVAGLFVLTTLAGYVALIGSSSEQLQESG
jgi:hypothetical protein